MAERLDRVTLGKSILNGRRCNVEINCKLKKQSIKKEPNLVVV